MIFDLQVGSFSIECAQPRLGVLGPSGCGKTSLLKAIAGLGSLTGRIRFQGALLEGPAWERTISYLPQDLQLLPHLTVRDNIRFPRNSHWDEEVIETLKLSPLLDRMPRHLSGGEQQRVALARTLCRKAQLYLLDEPFSSLDSNMRVLATQLIDEKIGEASLVLVSHQQQDLTNLQCQIWSVESQSFYCH